MKLPTDLILHVCDEADAKRTNIIAEWQGELVRCRNCKFCDTETPTPFKGGKCYGYFGRHSANGIYVKADDYCSRAERK